MEPWLERFAHANFQRSADTAHDLKTPLNVAVLNLELLRMRLRKIGAEEDEKLGEYTRAIETELRRMSRIFDAFFLCSTPPKGDEPGNVDAAAIVAHEAESHGFTLPGDGPAVIRAHEARIRQAAKLFFEGASKLLSEADRSSVISSDGVSYGVSVSGRLRAEGVELSKVFKLYYTDPEGNPDLSLAIARLIAETYGGELTAAEEDRDNVTLRLSFPLGA